MASDGKQKESRKRSMKILEMVLAVVVSTQKCDAFFLPSRPLKRPLRRPHVLASTTDTAAADAVVEQTPQLLTPLGTFNDLIDKRLVEADRVDRNPLLGSDDDDDSENDTPCIDFLDLMYMAFASATSTEMFEKRKRFAEQIHHAGGFCIVELDDIEASVIDGMWDCVDSLFRESDSQQQQQQDFRHQTLTRDNLAESHENSGYEFVQTTNIDGEIYPLTLKDTVGAKGSEQALHAYQLLSQLAKAYASVIYAGVTDTDPKESSDLISTMLNDNDRPFSGSYHRLCRYVKVKEDGWNESLRSHTDWSLSTPIPVSSIAGLELFNPATKTWIRPEATARKLWEQQQQQQQTSEEGNEQRWHSGYVVVMAGAWLELLTNGAFESTIHRVMSTKNGDSRKSAPFFMRPRELVFDKVAHEFDDDEKKDMITTPEEATERISHFLQEVQYSESSLR